jgi:cytochrome c oxidase cbb3-type subunit 3
LVDSSDWGALILVPLALLAAGCQQAERAQQSTESFSEQILAEIQVFAGQSVSDLMSDPAALRVGEQLFDAHCDSCHGAEASGARGAIDLTRHVFNYGVSDRAIYTTVSQGRLSEMPGMGKDLGEFELGEVVAFVQSLELESPLSSYAEAGKRLFGEKCANCHGTGGQGIRELGASNLADDYWQHGNSMMNIRLVITRGVRSECPGFTANPTSAENELLTAYVLNSISRD